MASILLSGFMLDLQRVENKTNGLSSANTAHIDTAVFRWGDGEGHTAGDSFDNLGDGRREDSNVVNAR